MRPLAKRILNTIVMISELTNNTRKMLASLSTAKGRREHGLFLAQGTKCVLDTLGHFRLECLLCTSAWAQEHKVQADCLVAKAADIERITTLSDAPQVIAAYHIPDPGCMPAIEPDKLYLALDCLQDPGNLGTILRVADWMGVDTVFASPDSVDVWSPKVVQATMGAISRVRVVYTDLPSLLADAGAPVFGTFLDGDNIYKASLPRGGVIVMGNEGRGISAAVAACCTRRLLIPSFPPGRTTSESLNVAVATAITLSEFRRNG